MTVLAGVGGAINTIEQVRTWQIESKADLAEYASSNTRQAMAAMSGNTDWSGSYAAYGAQPEAMPTEAFAFAGSIDGTNGASGTAIVESVEIDWDIEGGKPISHVVNFAANSALTIGAQAASDTSLLLPPSAIGTKIELGTLVAAPVWTAVTDVRTIKLTISAGNQAYASSSSSGGMLRKAGNIKCSLSYSIYEGDWANLVTPNTESAVRLYDDATSFWLIEWIKFGAASSLLVDREGAGLVGATMNAEHMPLATVDAAIAEGSITTPDTNEWWPLT